MVSNFHGLNYCLSIAPLWCNFITMYQYNLYRLLWLNVLVINLGLNMWKLQ